MINKIKAQLKPDKLLLKSGIIVFIGSMITNVVNYLFHLVMGRSLGPTEYGIAVTVISFLALLSIPLSTVSTVVTKFSSEAVAKNQAGEIKYLFNTLSKYLLLAGLILVVIIILFANKIGLFLHIDPAYIKVISVFLIFSLLIAVTRGILQGIKAFSAYTINTVIEVIIKLVLFILFFKLGMQIFSLVWALLLSGLIAYITSIFPLRKILKNKLQKIDLKVLFHYSSYALLTLALVSSLTYIDVLLVKHFLSPEEAGYYAALSTIGKIVIFLGTPMILVMFPLISEAHTKKEKHFHLLAQTTLAICLSSAVVLIMYYFAPSFIIKILYGTDYLSISNMLFPFGIAILFLTLGNLLVYYFLSIKEFSFVWLIFITIILEIFTIYQFHSNIYSIIYNLLYTYGFLFVSLSIMYVYIKRKRITKILKNI